MKTKLLVSALAILAAVVVGGPAEARSAKPKDVAPEAIQPAPDALPKPDLSPDVAGQVVFCFRCRGRGYTYEEFMFCRCTGYQGQPRRISPLGVLEDLPNTPPHKADPNCARCRGTGKGQRLLCRNCGGVGWLMDQAALGKPHLPLKPSVAATRLLQDLSIESQERCVRRLEDELIAIQKQLEKARADLAQLKGAPAPSPAPPGGEAAPAGPRKPSYMKIEASDGQAWEKKDEKPAEPKPEPKAEETQNGK